jgi:hypothetical protein
VNLILNKLIDDDIITPNKKPRIVEPLIETVSEVDNAKFKTMKSIGLDIE